MGKYIAPEIQASCADKMDAPTSTTVARGGSCTIQGSSSWWYRTFLKYDLSGIPSGSKIASAKMRVYASYWGDNAGNGTTNISRITTDWNDSSVSWNKQPSWEGAYLPANVSPPAVGSWSDWDITTLVQMWVDGTYPNYGLYIKNNNEGSYRYHWRILNHYYSDASLGSYLEIIYEGGQKPEEKTSGHIIRSGSTLYSVTDGTLTALAETEITASLFQTYGVDEIQDGALLATLTDPEVLFWQDSQDDLPDLSLTVTGTPPLPQVITSDSVDLAHESISAIDHVTANASEDVRFSVSFNGGATWLAYNGSGWVQTTETEPGMLASTMNAITTAQWAEIATLTSCMVRAWLPAVTSYVDSVVFHYINP